MDASSAAGQAQLFEYIINSNQTGVCVFDAVRDAAGTFLDFRFSYVNPAGAAIMGKHPEKLIGVSYRTYFSQAESSGLLAFYRTVLESGQPARLLEVPYFADGIRGWFDINVVKYQDAVVVSFVDISVLKRTQISERKQATFFNQLLQTTPNAVIAYEAIRQPTTDGTPGEIVDFKAVFFNPKYERLFGTPAATIQGQTFRARFDAEDKSLFDYYKGVVERGESFQRERYYNVINKWLLLLGEKLYDGFLLIINDITEQKETQLDQQQLTNALQTANQELLRSNENLQQFAYVASHDLQEPLRKIQQFGDLLKARTAGASEEAVDYLERMQSAAGRMSTLIKDLLSYARISTRQDENQPVPLAQVVGNVLDDLQVSIAEAQATVQVDELPTVTGDAMQLGQLFQNLIGNALKFRRADTALYIRVQCRLVAAAAIPGTVRIARQTTAYYQIDVIDNGIGFEEKYLDRIFQVFQRLHSRREFSGTGIGLAICEKVVANHGGAITAASQLNHGTTFSVYLPA